MSQEKQARDRATEARREAGDVGSGAPDSTSPGFSPRGRRRRVARTTKARTKAAKEYTGPERLLLLDTWMRSELPASEFSQLVGVASQTLTNWRRRFEEEGPAALLGYRRGQQGSRLPEPVRRAVLMMKQQHPDWGQDRIHDMLLRTHGMQASAGAVQRVLLEAGYEVETVPSRPNPPKVRRYERARPNQLWQTDLFSFLLKRQRRRVHLVGFLDDCSRFVVGLGVFGTASGANVRETFEAAIANYGAPEEILTDQGAQYHTWRGKSAFKKLCERRGIRQVVARAQHPQTLGKIERFWGTLWRELIESAIFQDLDEARDRIEHFASWYNFQRTHQGLDGLVPADRFFESAPEVRAAIEARVAENAKELALHGRPRKHLYLTGTMGDRPISLHTEGTKVVLTDGEGSREEVDLTAPGRRERATEEAPGTSALDGVLEDLAALEGKERTDASEDETSSDEASSQDEASDEPDEEASS
jgi:transposase InsO family protein